MGYPIAQASCISHALALWGIMARSLKAERTYEAANKRPGTPIGTRLSDEEIAAVDGLRDEASRSAWLLGLIRREIKRKGRN